MGVMYKDNLSQLERRAWVNLVSSIPQETGYPDLYTTLYSEVR